MPLNDFAGNQLKINPDGSLNVSNLSASATVVTNSTAGTTTATVATLPAAAGKTTYITTANISATATTAISLTFQLTNTLGGTLNYQLSAGAAPVTGTRDIFFDPPIPATAQNTTIVGTLSAAGAGGVTAVTLTGFQQ